MDALARHGLLSGLLVFHVATIYVAVLFLGGENDISASVPWSLNLLALALVGLTLLPVRAWLLPRIDALLRGGHEDPYGAMALLNERLDATLDAEAILPLVAQTIARTLHLPWVRIEAHGEPVPRAGVAGQLPATATTVEVPLGFRGTSVGSLRVASRWPDGVMPDEERKLLGDLARQVSITLYSLRLTDDLQASRERLVAAREEERLRLRRDLHDGLGPALSALRLQLRALRAIVRTDPERAEALVDELRTDLRATTAEIRSLVFALRPPLLDEHGLLGAIRHLDVALDGAQLQVTAPEALPRLPAAVEVALYRITAEAVHNVARHAGATTCRVELGFEDAWVRLRIEDDGVGMADRPGEGVGMHSMRERATELGGRFAVRRARLGGTRVEAWLPFDRPAAASLSAKSDHGAAPDPVDGGG
jgi:signal transduction histidine kinase